VSLPALSPHELEALKAGARAKLAIEHLSDFVRQAWPIVEPGAPLVWNWHLGVICDTLEKLTRGELYQEVLDEETGTITTELVTEVVICIPPGMCKSLLVSVFWPAWVWLARPTERNLNVSNSDRLVRRDSRKARDIIDSPWYQSLVKIKARADGEDPDDAWTLKIDHNQVDNYATTRQGFRAGFPIGGKITGNRGDGIGVDDPYDVAEVLLGSPVVVLRRMMEVRTRYYGVLASRLADRRVGYRVVVMQRLHQADLAGEMIRRGAYTIVLPMEYDPDHPELCPADPRTQPGELLFPAMVPRAVVDALKSELGSQAAAAQLGQRPTAAEGGIFHRDWLAQFYDFDPQTFTAADEWAITVDCTFKGTADTDFVAMQVWARKKKAAFYLLGRVCARMTYTQTRTALRLLCQLWPQVKLKLVEEKANGAAIIDDLKQEIPGIVAFNPDKHGDKFARAQLVARFFEASNIHLPSPERCPWVGDYIETMAGFGAGAAHDDDVDATTQLLIYWTLAESKSPLERAREQAALVGAIGGM